MPYSRENRYVLLSDSAFLEQVISDLTLIRDEYMARSALSLPYLRFNRQRVNDTLFICSGVFRDIHRIALSLEGGENDGGSS